MFVPEYSITPKTLHNIALIEYGKAVMDLTPILPVWKRQMQKEAQQKALISMLKLAGITIGTDTVKLFVDGLHTSPPQELTNSSKALLLLADIGKTQDIEELDVKFLHKTLAENLLPKTRQGLYRGTKLGTKAPPEEILAQTVQLFDWLNSLEAKENHPLVNAAIVAGAFEQISPFDSYNSTLAALVAQLLVNTAGYDFGGTLTVIDCIGRAKHEYEHLVNSLAEQTPDFTSFIEFITETMALEVSTIKEKVHLLARDTKIAKVSGRNKLSPRQERIVEYLQDYGLLQNRDFPKLFPGVSEDSVLRDLKALLDKGIIQKTGSTKSSRYELG